MKYREFMDKVDTFLKKYSKNIVFHFINFSLLLFFLSSSVILVSIPELSFTFNISGSSSIDTINETVTISNSFFITACFILITIIRAIYFFVDILVFGLFSLKCINNLLKDLVAFQKEKNYKKYRKNTPKYPY